MAFIGNGNAIAAFQQFYAVDVVYSSCIGRTFGVTVEKNTPSSCCVQCRTHSCRLTRSGHGSVFHRYRVEFKRIDALIYSGIDSLEQIMVNITAVSLNGIFNVIRLRSVALREMLCYLIHFREFR